MKASEVEVGSVMLEKLDVIGSSTITDNNRYENIFNFKGTVHLNCYMALNEKSTVKDVIELLCKDVDNQFSNRLEIFEDESQNNSKLYYSYVNHHILVAMVNPFDLNTDNMTRIDNFNLLLPRRVCFEINDSSGLPSLKHKLVFNDYLLYYETEEESHSRFLESTGLKPKLPMTSFERIGDADLIEKKLLKVAKAQLAAKPKMSKEEVKTELSSKVEMNAREIEIRKHQLRLSLFVVAGVLMILSYTYVYLYLM